HIMSGAQEQRPITLEQTMEGWDSSAVNYNEVMSLSRFTQKFALVALDQTIPPNTTLPSGIKIIDIGAGSGALSIPAAERVKPYGGTVLATDFAPSMINVLNKKIGGLPIETKVMDGQCLECADNTFDYAFSVFALIFFPDQLKGAKEMYRVLHPGGKAAITSWSQSSPIGSSMGACLTRLYSEAGLAVPPPPAYFPVSSLADTKVFEKLLVDAGFKNVQITPSAQSFDIDIDTFIKFLDSNPVITNTKASLPESIRHKFNDTFAATLREKFTNGQLGGEYLAYIAVAEK
ncbi:hypothetical protein SAMD00019534_071100, partial [Acytostelium subglobosum LB1]|uniref:hypothetical protein n=1 Tax=Acytostelium subglobosum LB1 TaxID=1410327 RepID=UPI000644A41E